jgi:hypothetical protein
MNFEAVIGIEIHVEMKTKSKMFSSSPIAFGREANTLVRPLDIAFPGTMPIVNKQAVINAIRVSNALNMEIDNELYFDRKNYFYSDLPKGFQITQDKRPIGKNGYVDVKLSDGSVIVQKYGDIKKGRRSTYKRIAEGFVKPTLKEAIPGDLGLVLPYNFMKSLIEMIEALNYVSPGIASDHTLFYGVEAKFYSDRPIVDNNFESSIKNLYLGGDGAGITRGLAQAGANGVKIARVIINKNN